MRSIGIFGGTFDPIHLGHLIAAQSAREKLGLAKVAFVTAGRPPHKQGRTITPAKLRYRMVRLAIAGNTALTALDLELAGGSPAYTVDTLHVLRRKFPRYRLHLLIGMDQALALDTWREPQELFELAEVDVLTRPRYGSGQIQSRWRRRVKFVEVPQIDIAASDIRARVRRKLSIRYLVPEKVAALIRRYRLYLNG